MLEKTLVQASHPQGLRMETVALYSRDVRILVVDNLTLVGA
jgi:hypothetical protein